MAKITTTVPGTKFDPNLETMSELHRLGLKPTVQVQEFGLAAQEDRLNAFSNIDVNEFKPDSSLFSSDTEARSLLEEQRAREQGILDKAFKGVGRVGSTILTEVLKTPGYLGGAIGSSIMNGEFIENTVNNAWVNAFESMDESLKNAMPVYLTQEVQEGGIGAKLMSASWWATTGADGVGFMLSMYAPGQLLKALNVGSYMAKGVEGMAKFAGANSGFTKALTASSILKNTMGGIQVTDKAIAGMQSASAVALNTFIESSAEAANTFDNVKKDYLSSNPNATDEEANLAAGQAASSVMKANIGVLALSNLADEIFLFKGFGQTAEKSAKESILGKLFTDGKFDKEAIAALKREGIKEFGKKSLPKLAANFAKEGMFEEGLQTRIQQHYENVANGSTEAGFWDDVVGGYFEGLMNDPEMQEAVVLGGILGGGASMIALSNEITQRNDMLFGRKSNYPSFIAKILNRKEKTEAPGLLKLLDDNFVNSFRTIHDIAELSQDGKPVFENGKLKIDEAKLKEMVEQKQNTILLNQLHNIAILEGNQAEEDMYGDQLAFNYFLPFLQQEGGYEVLKQHIDSQLVELMAKKVEDATGKPPTEKDKIGIKVKLNKRADEFHDVYDEVHRTTNTELNVAPSDKNYGAWKQTVRDRKMQSLLQYNSATKALTELNTKFPIDLNEDDLAVLTPVQIVEQARAKKVKKQYEEFAAKAKQKYIDLSSSKGLKEDYNRYNKKIEELTTKAAEEVAKEEKPVENIESSQDFENEIVTGGYETIRNSNMKGFYIKGERLVVENSNGERGMVESVYDPKLQRTDQYFINKAGKRTKVTDDNGNITQAFLKNGFKPISKEQLSKERKALAIVERKQAQLALLQEFIDYRNRQIGSTEREIEEIEQEVTNYTEQLNKAQEEIKALFQTKTSNKARNVAKKQLKAQQETLTATITSIENTIKNLQERRVHLLAMLPRIEALRNEYEKIKQLVAEQDAFSFKQELKKVGEELFTTNMDDWELTQEDINQVNKTITAIEDKIDQLEWVKKAIRNTLAANETFLEMIKLNQEDRDRAFKTFNAFFSGIPIPYAIDRINQLIQNDLVETVQGETLAKNNIITNVVEIVEWFNANPSQIERRLGLDRPVTEEDVYRKIGDLLQPYTESLQALQRKSPLSLEDVHEMESKVFVTNKELNELNSLLNEQKDKLAVSDIYRRYVTLEKLVREKVEQRYNELRTAQAEKTLDFSQKQKGSLPEPGEEPDMRDIFYQHALPSTPFSTTGISVLYEKEGQRKGKDKLDENGFPQLNDNEFQRVWFLTVDKLSDEIGNYMLMPIKAKYDSSDDFQKAIEANFPNESQRSNNDVFVFLVNKDGKPIKVDTQGNLLKDGGNFVFTSLRKPNEVFLEGKKPKVAPDYILSEYLKSLGIKDSFNYEKIKGRKIKDFATSKAASIALKDLIELDKSAEDLFEEAIKWNREEYSKFINSLTITPGFLDIQTTTRGYPLYQMGKDGKKIQHKPLATFKQVTLNTELGTKQLQGGTLGVAVKGSIQSKGQLINLPSGTVYLKFQNEEFITLQSRNVNKEETKTIMYLLSLADTINPLNTITIPFPKKKNGDSYYYYLGEHRVTETMPVFARRLPNGEPFSLLHTLINYGFKAEGKNKKGEIYIQYGKLHYIDFNGQSHQINLKELSDSVLSDKFENHSEATKELFDFLLQKRFNIEKNLLKTNPIFMYPKLRKLKNGQYDIEFDFTKTYYDYMLNNVLTTSATHKEGYPNQLQRNVVYNPELVTAKPSKSESTLPKNDKIKGTKPPKVESKTDNIKENWIAQKRVSMNNLRTTIPEFLDDEIVARKVFDEKLKPQLEAQSKELKVTITESDLTELFNTYFRGIENKPLPPALQGILPEDTKNDDRFEETRINEKKLTPQEKLDTLRNKKRIEIKPKTGMAKPNKDTADKIGDVNKILDEYIEQGIVQKKCK